MDNMWYDIDCEEFCRHIANCVNTTHYNCRLKEAMIDGTSFFGMGGMGEDDWKLFFDTAGVKSFLHMRLLKKWASKCNEKERIVDEAPGLAPSEGKHPRKVMPLGTVMARSTSTVTQSKKKGHDFDGWELENTESDPPSKTQSPCDSMCGGKTEKGMEFYIPRTHCSMTPHPPPKVEVSSSSHSSCDSEKPEVKRLKMADGGEDNHKPADSQVYYKRKGGGSSQTDLQVNRKVAKEEKTREALGVLRENSQGNVKGTQRRGRGCNKGKENSLVLKTISSAAEVKARSKLLMGKVKVEDNSVDKRAHTSISKGDDENDDEVLIDVDLLSPYAIQVVCMRAMGLLSMSTVEANMKSWISGMNSNVARANKPFKGHSRMDSSELLAMVAKWSIQTKFVIIRAPPEVSMDGVQRLFPENVKRNARK